MYKFRKSNQSLESIKAEYLSHSVIFLENEKLILDFRSRPTQWILHLTASRHAIFASFSL